MDTQEQFIIDLHEFITNHPHFKANQGITNPKLDQDFTTYNIHDPNGDYEKVLIRVQGIS